MVGPKYNEDMKALERIGSIINGGADAGDAVDAYTPAELAKLTGPSDADGFALYSEYLTRWASARAALQNADPASLVRERLLDTLSAVTLSYSSYEEQRFLRDLDWNDPAQVERAMPLYAQRIREICEFYRGRRDAVPDAVRRNSLKGSTRSVERIVYDKIVDYALGRRGGPAAVASLKRTLSVSIENYVDAYGDYFDYADRGDPDAENFDPRVYTDAPGLLSELLYNGEARLKEIPLVAQMGLDLGAECVGDMLALKQTLLEGASMDRLGPEEAVRIRRRLYSKYLGCDLYYIYCDANGNVTHDILARAQNPSGNLLNCGSADLARTPRGCLRALCEIGLFFKPDRIGVLKVAARDYSWTIDTSRLQRDTWYVFPDPDAYGDIGVNKSDSYPLVMTYRLGDDIRGGLPGLPFADPLVAMAQSSWRSYYSREEDTLRPARDGFSDGFARLAGFKARRQSGDPMGNEAVHPDTRTAPPLTDRSKGVVETEDAPEPALPRTVHIINGGYFTERGSLFPFRFAKGGAVGSAVRTGLVQDNAAICARLGLMFPPGGDKTAPLTFALASALEGSGASDNYAKN